jgi:hypothetical protein
MKHIDNAIKGTAKPKQKTKLNWWEYWIEHCIATGWQSVHLAFKTWKDLMTSNYEGYNVLDEDDAKEECIFWFWSLLNEDETISKNFLENLLQMCADIDSGKVKTYPFPDDFDSWLEEGDEDE